MARRADLIHEVFNQSPVFGGHNAWLGDPLLRRIGSALPAGVREGLEQHGKWTGARDTIELAQLANRQVPVLKTHDAKGNRIDRVEFHPAWHAFMRKSVSVGLHSSAWEKDTGESGHRQVARAIRFYMTSGVEAGHLCPLTMTNAAVAALMVSSDISEEWLPLILSRKYDPAARPPVQKSGVTIGMGMTEKQGGTDVRANTSKAEPASDGIWRLTGHKWFFSAPMSDAFLVLAQVKKEGLSCFLVPRLLPDGEDNGLRLQRLKDKLGNRSNASAEVEFNGSLAQMVGEPGGGVATIIRMVNLTRLDCAVASAGLMRASIWESVEHCRHRFVFQIGAGL